MPACTYLGQNEYLAPTGVKALDEALAELRSVTGEDWRVAVRRFVTGRLWWRKEVQHFELYCGLGGGEFQIINFYRDGTDWSINHYVPAELVVAYIFGTIGGATHPARRTTSDKSDAVKPCADCGEPTDVWYDGTHLCWKCRA